MRRIAASSRRFSGASQPDVVVCGAGVVGVACAHYLSRAGASVLMVDERPPLSYTSSLSTECYRNFWGGHVPMTQFMNRSIDLLEQRATETANAFSMNRRGYCFLSATAEGAARHASTARAIQGARVFADGAHGERYRGAELPYDATVDELSVFQGREAVSAFLGGSFVSDDIVSVLYSGRCGWMNAQQMGSVLLEQARTNGARTLTPARLMSVRATENDAISTVRVRTADGAEQDIACGAFVNCAGPYASAVNQMLLASPSSRAPPLPLRNEIHAKAMLKDEKGAVPMSAPMSERASGHTREHSPPRLRARVRSPSRVVAARSWALRPPTSCADACARAPPRLSPRQ